jgi:hypothetical protein
MKWYSVKKYSIPINLGFLFVAIDMNGMFSTGIAEYTHDANNDDFNWFDRNGSLLSHVTHFCIPDPIEIEGE